ncbi:hypothetical protein [Streptomyces griseocarneus]|uniref:hypothetical protein n=1 Tax=Streptomyces griseocarneus TaxID=51201 RepID=UPI00167CCAFB|nr:hypothetical protein [Streptomyces griseocarneus]MBZ6475861.1 hypothetical protein [Streptomyces griseocarneus]GHG50344.1 hypothetical protein GCM10018779_10380 [Streptomyces griseocarneus]
MFPRSARQAERHAVEFPPVENGVDYLLSVVDHLAGDGPPSPRDLKYAVLHLQAAAEVLLKARLQREHWSLVFKDPGTATRSRFDSADFESCTTDAAVDRLKHIAGIPIDDKAGKALKVLAKSRNALQHYGLTAPARAVEARAAEVLDFLLTFLHDHLLPHLTEQENQRINADLNDVREGVQEIQSFIAQRGKHLRGELHDLGYQTVECPSCGEWALPLGDTQTPNCRFCHESWASPTIAAAYYVRAQYGDQETLLAGQCPQCAEPALLLDKARVAAEPTQPRSLCFHCGSSFDRLVECTGCAALTMPRQSGLCEDCLQDPIRPFELKGRRP